MIEIERKINQLAESLRDIVASVIHQAEQLNLFLSICDKVFGLAETDGIMAHSDHGGSSEHQSPFDARAEELKPGSVKPASCTGDRAAKTLALKQMDTTAWIA